MSYRDISGRQTERGDLAPLKISVTCVTRVTDTVKPLKPKGFQHVTQPNGWLNFGVTGAELCNTQAPDHGAAGRGNPEYETQNHHPTAGARGKVNG